MIGSNEHYKRRIQKNSEKKTKGKFKKAKQNKRIYSEINAEQYIDTTFLELTIEKLLPIASLSNQTFEI